MPLVLPALVACLAIGGKHHAPPIVVEDGKLMATVQVASVGSDGRLKLPQDVKAIWIDVGTNSEGFLQTSAGTCCPSSWPRDGHLGMCESLSCMPLGRNQLT